MYGGINLHQKSRVLEIGLADGTSFKLPCEYLRVYSPAAQNQGPVHGKDEESLQIPVTVTNVQTLLAWLHKHGPAWAEAFKDNQVQVTVNKQFAELFTLSASVPSMSVNACIAVPPRFRKTELRLKVDNVLAK